MRKEEIEQAREMDLLLYLQRYEPESWYISAATPTAPVPMTA